MLISAEKKLKFAKFEIVRGLRQRNDYKRNSDHFYLLDFNDCTELKAESMLLMKTMTTTTTRRRLCDYDAISL